MLEQLHISKDTLAKTHTKDLIDITLDYSLFDYGLAYNSMQSGFGQVARNFTELQDLLSRKDAASELLIKYKNLEVNLKKLNASLKDQVAISKKIRRLEQILAQETILNNLSANDQKQLLRLSLKNIKAKQLDKELYEALGYEATAIVLGRVLAKNNKNDLRSATQESLNEGSLTILDSLGEFMSLGEQAAK